MKNSRIAAGIILMLILAAGFIPLRHAQARSFADMQGDTAATAPAQPATGPGGALTFRYGSRTRGRPSTAPQLHRSGL